MKKSRRSWRARRRATSLAARPWSDPAKFLVRNGHMRLRGENASFTLTVRLLRGRFENSSADFVLDAWHFGRGWRRRCLVAGVPALAAVGWHRHPAWLAERGHRGARPLGHPTHSRKFRGR